MEYPVDPKVVIDDLLEQIKNLSLENAMMRSFLKSLANSESSDSAEDSRIDSVVQE